MKKENTENKENKDSKISFINDDGGYLNNAWDSLSYKDKAEMMKVAIANGITTLSEIQKAYNEFAEGGYIPSDSIKKRIANWEGTSMKTNRSFELEAKDFNKYLPKGAKDKLTQQQLDALYSYSYNVGAGNFNKRVVPILTDYLKGRASKEDVQKAMYATRDNELRGLTLRRNAERKMFGGNYQSTFTGQKNSPQLGYIDRNQQYRNIIDNQRRQKNILLYEEDNQNVFKNPFGESNINVDVGNILGINTENRMTYAQIPTSKLDIATILQSANTPTDSNIGQSILPNYPQIYLNEFDSDLMNS